MEKYNAQKKQEFLNEFPDYGYLRSEAGFIDSWRPSEYPSLINCQSSEGVELIQDNQLVYVDHAGATLASKSQFQDSMTILQNGGGPTKGLAHNFPYCNPHSSGPAATATSEAIHKVKSQVLSMVKGTGKYELIFTSGATQSFQKVVEHFPFTAAVTTSNLAASKKNNHSKYDTSSQKTVVTGSSSVASIFAHTKDCHTSVLGMRAIAKKQGAIVTCLPRDVTSKAASPVFSQTGRKTRNSGSGGDGGRESYASRLMARATTIISLGEILNKQNVDSCNSNSGKETREQSDKRNGTSKTNAELGLWDRFVSMCDASKVPLLAMAAACVFLAAGVSSGGGWKSASFFVAASNASLIALFTGVAILFQDEDDEENEEEEDTVEGDEGGGTRKKKKSESISSHDSDFSDNEDFSNDSDSDLETYKNMKKKKKRGLKNTSKAKEETTPIKEKAVPSTIHHLLVYAAECNFDGVRHDLALPFSMKLAAQSIKEIKALKKKLNSSSGKEKGERDFKNGGARTGSEFKSTFDKEEEPSSPSVDLESDVKHKWWVCLDAAKWCGTSELDLETCPADFVCLSFYKIFGFPTGLGCLLIRSEAAKLLSIDRESRYFGGGTLAAALAGSDWQRFRPDVSSLSNGTEHFQGIISLQSGFKHVKYLGGMEAISKHSHACAALCARHLQAMKHLNGSNVVVLYGAWPNENQLADQYDDSDTNTDTDDDDGDNVGGPFKSTSKKKSKILSKKWSYKALHLKQGPVVTFNVKRPNGSIVGYAEVEKMASLNEPPIQLRTGCFCNPGACQNALELSDEVVIAQHLEGGHACGDSHDMVNGRPTGAVRVSFGSCSTFEDVMEVVEFIDRVFKQLAPEIDQALQTAAKSRHYHDIQKVTSVENRSILDITDDVTKCDKKQEKEEDILLEEMWIYPVKSCGGMRVKKWPIVLPTGSSINQLEVGGSSNNRKKKMNNLCLLLDRSFAVVDKHTRTPLRTRQFRQLATVKPLIDLEKGIMTLSASSMTEMLTLDLGCKVKVKNSSSQKDVLSAAMDNLDKKKEALSFKNKFNTSGHASKVSSDVKENSGDGDDRWIEEEEEEEETIDVCWNKSCAVHEPYPEASQWFSELLGEPCSLVRVKQKTKSSMKSGDLHDGEKTNKKQASPSSPSSSSSSSSSELQAEQGSTASFSETFSNEAPFLLISQQSVDFLNEALQQISTDKLAAKLEKEHGKVVPLSSSSAAAAAAAAADQKNVDKEKKDSACLNKMSSNEEHISARNFRPNFVVGSGSSSGFSNNDGKSYSHLTQQQSHREDKWKSIKINDLFFDISGDCSRCAMIEIDPESGENAASGALRTLASYRRHHSDILFGKYLKVSHNNFFSQARKGSSISDGDEATAAVLVVNFGLAQKASERTFALHWIKEGAHVQVIEEEKV